MDEGRVIRDFLYGDARADALKIYHDARVQTGKRSEALKIMYEHFPGARIANRLTGAKSIPSWADDRIVQEARNFKAALRRGKFSPENNKTEQFNLRITPDERAFLEAVAAERSTSLGSVVRWAIQKAFKEGSE